MSRQQSGRRLTKFHFGENYLLYVRQGLARCVVSVSKSGRCLFLCLNIEKRSDRGCGWVSESPSFLSLCLSVSVKGCPPGSAHFLFFSFFFAPLASYANLLVNADPHNEQRHRVHPRLHPRVPAPPPSKSQHLIPYHAPSFFPQHLCDASELARHSLLSPVISPLE